MRQTSRLHDHLIRGTAQHVDIINNGKYSSLLSSSSNGSVEAADSALLALSAVALYSLASHEIIGIMDRTETLYSRILQGHELQLLQFPVGPRAYLAHYRNRHRGELLVGWHYVAYYSLTPLQKAQSFPILSLIRGGQFDTLRASLNLLQDRLAEVEFRDSLGRSLPPRIGVLTDPRHRRYVNLVDMDTAWTGLYRHYTTFIVALAVAEGNADALIQVLNHIPTRGNDPHRLPTELRQLALLWAMETGLHDRAPGRFADWVPKDTDRERLIYCADEFGLLQGMRRMRKLWQVTVNNGHDWGQLCLDTLYNPLYIHFEGASVLGILADITQLKQALPGPRVQRPFLPDAIRDELLLDI
ncbi:hypothetical protein H4R33_004684 [Dimargaris cristalligena]|nr:hypothetical protein H4R33_004684 [Dimargaris cristalligena]